MSTNGASAAWYVRHRGFLLASNALPSGFRWRCRKRSSSGVLAADADDPGEDEARRRVLVGQIHHLSDIRGDTAFRGADDRQLGRVLLVELGRPAGRDRSAGVAHHPDPEILLQSEWREIPCAADTVEGDPSGEWSCREG